MAKPKLPKVVYLRHMYPSNDDEPWLEANEDLDDTAELGEVVTVGEYHLVKKIKVATKVTTE